VKKSSNQNYIFFKKVDAFEYENQEFENQNNLGSGNFEKCILSHLKNHSAYYFVTNLLKNEFDMLDLDSFNYQYYSNFVDSLNFYLRFQSSSRNKIFKCFSKKNV